MGSAASSLKAAAASASDQELTDALAQLDPADLAKLKTALGINVVVVGWGPVGHAVVTKLLAKSAAMKITVITEESYPAYNRVKLSSFFEHRDPNKLALSSAEWCRENGVELVFGRASKVDRAAKTVDVDCGGETKTVSYDELVLATGSKAWLPPVPGLSLEVAGVFVYRTISDIFQITERAKFSKKAVVIGGGLLGLEAAKAAYDLGLETTILEVAPHLMPVQLDLDAGKILQSKIEALGLKVKTGVKVLGVETGSDGLTGVKIEAEGQEETLEATLLIVGAGVRPRQELAEMSGLELGGRGGIKVDHRMRSATDEHVWAVGEIASFNGGMCYQLSAPGYTQAEILADHMTNPKAESKFADADLSTKLKLLGVDVASFGGSSDFWFKRQYSSSGEEIMSKVSKDEAAGVYKKLVFTPDGTKLLGGILVGDISAFAPLTAVSKRSDLGGVSPDELMAGQMPKVDDGGDGTNLGDDDHVCNCHSVPKKVIRDAIMKGAHTFEEIKKCTKAGTGCGTCIRNGPQPKLLAHTLNAKGVEAGVCKSLPFTHDDIEDLAKARQLKSYDELVSHLGYPSAAAESDKTALGGLLDRIGGKPKGEGLDHLGQLKALKEDLWKFVDKMNCNPILVRLAWHDAGTYDKSKTAFGERGGANGSIRFSPEISMGANNGLDKGVKYLEPFKADYPLVSYADLYQMAAAVSIEHAGGPKIDMKYGRKDASGPDDCPGRQSRGTADNAGLPDAEPGPDGAFGCGAKDAATHLRNIFYRMGFDDKGIVALSGAHTIGRAFKERSGTVKEGYGESSACPYTRSMPKGCPIRNDGGYGVGMPGGKSWTTKWLKFDNEYFQPSVYEEKDKDLLWLSSDRCLHQDEGFKQYFMLYKDDQAAFFRDFAEAYKQLSEQGAEFEPEAGLTL
ncbi:Probable L-ascorbate peroxidase 7 [Durusdinium trenchii]|uniref:Chloroplastic (OsAPx7) n=1 Tax=Durusdinium trenchii TaxID=1381693 RepID=A0ABP0QCC9_9DINO